MPQLPVRTVTKAGRMGKLAKLSMNGIGIRSETQDMCLHSKLITSKIPLRDSAAVECMIV